MRTRSATARAKSYALPDELWAHVAGALAAREIARVACVAKRFGRTGALTSRVGADGPLELLPIAVAAARRAVAARPAYQRAWASPDLSWPRRAAEIEALAAPLAFRAFDDPYAAGEIFVSRTYLRRGRHSLEFSYLEGMATTMHVGVSTLDFDGSAPGLGDHNGGVGWFFHAYSGNLIHCNTVVGWDGKSQFEFQMPCVMVGDTVRLEVDLDRQTMGLWVNGESFGLLARPGQFINPNYFVHANSSYEGFRGDDSCFPLIGPLQWTIKGGGDPASWRVDGPLPPLGQHDAQ